MSVPTVYIVGAGPGDPELITVKGQRIIEEADLILYTDSLVNPALFKHIKQGAVVQKSAGMALEEIVSFMVEAVKAGKNVARVHTGDPTVYGAVLEQMRMLHEQQIETEIIPGVSSAFAAAASAGLELTVPELTQTVILTRAEGRTPMPDKEKLVDLARHQCSTALFLSAALIKKVVDAFFTAGWSADDACVVVYKASWPDEKIVRTTLGNLHEDMRKNRITKQAMVIISKAADERVLQSGKYQSKLYDKTFTHGYRKGVPSYE
ncbi:precorrin-4/cobalt-precorrin-4 C11-methyltransferase [Alteribacillus persepolensis]|uniref:Precorrin-4/cobalt-precorrin-4 C11-methyltransferase n=1 Tax=Alteribacillus persepolensis TaxID=568899 RepID=A0A1G7Z5C5_9BACI|nr:precorrin-4 C(11)-methyltransferase [Alteribacillus persepolensis]SDH03789.1 precorrin-4/cobalt-precorrin-4 C11-methyltransferase [Alteribacillus persepolensis]